MERDILKNQKGFTLVEIIAVLIILGILAAVATPKFFDMQIEAEKKAVQAAVAELNAQVTLSWAQSKLTGDDIYTGFTGDLGTDFVVAPAEGKDGDPSALTSIKLANSTEDPFVLTWTAGTDSGPGKITVTLE